MRDASSSYWFSLGDKVKVVEDVYKAGNNLLGRTGIVVETWEKCDVDPTCCCAEQVDIGMAVRVKFEEGEEVTTTTTATKSTTEMAFKEEKEVKKNDEAFFHYFAEEELIKVKEIEEKQNAGPVTTETTRNDGGKSDNNIEENAETKKKNVPFDGLSCTAFKMDRLKMDEHKRGITPSYDPNNSAYQ